MSTCRDIILMREISKRGENDHVLSIAALVNCILEKEAGASALSGI